MENKATNANVSLTIKAINAGIAIKTVNSFKKVIKVSLGKVLEELFLLEDCAIKRIYHKQVALEVMLVNDNKIKAVNWQFRSKNTATNVLSLQFFTKDELQNSALDFISLGVIFISIDTLKKEATEYGLSEEEHLLRLFVHGFLHLIGYDHQSDELAKAMYEKESYLLSRLNVKAKSLVSAYWDA